MTTDPAPAIELSANGTKNRGTHIINLNWTSSSGANMDIYRNGALQDSHVSGSSYGDSTGNKGGATYQHQVCETGGTSACSNITTTVF